MKGPVLFCGDPHGEFEQVIKAAERTNACSVILLGDLEPQRPLRIELAPLLKRGVPTWFIHGNHDADSDDLWMRVWGGMFAGRNVHRRVVKLPDGRRLAGLGGVFRESVWYPSTSAAREGAPAYRTRKEHSKATPRQDRFGDLGIARRHWGSIYPEDVDRLSDLRADILITHEAPGYHPQGFELLDVLAQSMCVSTVVHGHHHDALDSSAEWARQGASAASESASAVCQPCGPMTVGK